jgi:hypothetical protein
VALARGDHGDCRARTLLVSDDDVIVAAGTILERLDPSEAADLRAPHRLVRSTERELDIANRSSS